MLTPNGGVFGRNPKFNNVQVDGNLTVNGDIALGDDITVTDTLTVNGAATFAAGATSQVTSASTSAVVPALVVNSQSTGTPANGFGTAIQMAAETSPGNTEIGAVIESVIKDATAGSEDFDIVFKIMRNGAAAAEAFRISRTDTSTQGNFVFTVSTDTNQMLILRNSGDTVDMRMNLRSGSTLLPAFGTYRNQSLDLVSNGVERMRLGTNGNISVLNGNLLMTTAGTGIDFSATANGSGAMTSELLDDYEEGTWSPAYSASTTPFTTAPTMDIKSATYTKIGRQVTVRASIMTDAADNTGGVGNLTVTGLPFAAATGDAALSAGSVATGSDFSANGVPHSMYPNGSTLVLTKRSASDGTVANSPASDLQTSASADQNALVFCITYFTD